MSICYLYWIKRPDDNDPLTQGYIGISKNVELRWKHHKYTAKTTNKNHKLYNALRKYEDFSIVVLLEGSREYCLNQEKEYRPSKNIGLNHSIGGVSSNITTPEDFDEVIKVKISEGLKRAYDNNEKYRKAVKTRNIGKVRTTEHRQALSEMRKGRGKGWKNSMSKDLTLWENADKHYDAFLKMLEDCKDKYRKYSVKLFCEYSGISLSTHQSIYKMFKDGWNPTQDNEWLAKFK